MWVWEALVVIIVVTALGAWIRAGWRSGVINRARVHRDRQHDPYQEAKQYLRDHPDA